MTYIYIHTCVCLRVNSCKLNCAANITLLYVLLSVSRRKLKQKRDKKMIMLSAANAKREQSAQLTYSIEYLTS